MSNRHLVLPILVALFAACGTRQPGASDNQISVPTNSSIVGKITAPEKTPIVASSVSSSPTACASAAPEQKDSAVPPPTATKESGQTPGQLRETATNFDQIKTGMSYPEVAQTLGSAGEKAGEFKTQNGLMTMYRWTGKGERGEWILAAQFENGKLTNKSQFGLK